MQIEKIQTSFRCDQYFSSGKEEERGVRIEQELTVSAHRALSHPQLRLRPMRFNAIHPVSFWPRRLTFWPFFASYDVLLAQLLLLSGACPYPAIITNSPF
jgi:hypothetical protein